MSDPLLGSRPKGHHRDIRVDFFRGVALILIFIDHIPGNVFARVTLANFGFADAAEIFVLLAGIGAFFAYATAFAEGSGRGFVKVGSRMRDLYAAHLLVLVVCVAGLAVVARAFQNPIYFEHVNLIPFNDDPAGAAGTRSRLPAGLPQHPTSVHCAPGVGATVVLAYATERCLGF